MTESVGINPAVVEWFRQRGISEGTIRAMGVYSGTRHVTGDGKWEVVPDDSGEVICFPSLVGIEPVNVKFRERGKRFYQTPGGEKVFYNCNVLDDPMLAEGKADLVIVEGEPDCLAVQEAGNPFVVSVPDGAPPAHNKPNDTATFDPEHDTKYSYLLRHWDQLKRIKRIVMAVDADEPGKRLAEELVRRLGRARCSFVTYPADTKDMNEVLLKYGPEGVWDLLKNAKPYPVSGVYTLDDLPPEPALTPVSTGFVRLDEYIKVFYPAFMVVTGLAGSGKSTWTNQMVAQLAYRHGWRVAISSFEMRIRPFVTNTLKGVYHEAAGGSDAEAMDWIRDNFVFIAPEPSDSDEQFDIDWLIDRAIVAVVRHGIRVLVIDPWNEIEHAVRKHESLTDYTGRAIRALKRFGREFECLVIVVAHPVKSAADKAVGIIQNKDGTEEKVCGIGLYDVSDSAHFANKADLGVVIARYGGNVTGVWVKKVRYQPDSGTIGTTELTYDPVTRIFSQ